MYVTGGSSNGPAIYATAAAWSETSITWNNRPARVNEPLEDRGAVAAGWQDFDVIGKNLLGRDDQRLYRYEPGTLNMLEEPIAAAYQGALGAQAQGREPFRNE